MVLADDLDNNGHMELVAATMNGNVYAFQTAAEYHPLKSWTSAVSDLWACHLCRSAVQCSPSLGVSGHSGTSRWSTGSHLVPSRALQVALLAVPAMHPVHRPRVRTAWHCMPVHVSASQLGALLLAVLFDFRILSNRFWLCAGPRPERPCSTFQLAGHCSHRCHTCPSRCARPQPECAI